MGIQNRSFHYCHDCRPLQLHHGVFPSPLQPGDHTCLPYSIQESWQPGKTGRLAYWVGGILRVLLTRSEQSLLALVYVFNLRKASFLCLSYFLLNYLAVLVFPEQLLQITTDWVPQSSRHLFSLLEKPEVWNQSTGRAKLPQGESWDSVAYKCVLLWSLPLSSHGFLLLSL